METANEDAPKKWPEIGIEPNIAKNIGSKNFLQESHSNCAEVDNNDKKLHEDNDSFNEQNGTFEKHVDSIIIEGDMYNKTANTCGEKSMDNDVRKSSLDNGITYSSKGTCYKPMPHEYHFRNHRVGIAPADDDVNLVEVRPGRILRILHVNAMKRDAIFEQEMQQQIVQENHRVCSAFNKANESDVNRRSYSEYSLNKNANIWCDYGRRRFSKMNKRQGEIDKKCVLFFLHGVGGSADVWSAQIKHFAASGYQIVALDLIGHGFSCTPSGSSAYMFREIMQDVCALFDLYCHRSNIIIAHSYGTSFAAVLARRRSWCISHMVFVSGGAPIPLGPQIGVFSMPTCLLSCCRPVILNNFHRNAFYKGSHAGVEGTFDVPSYVLKHVMNGQLWPEGGDQYHRGIGVPTLVIHGKQDRLVPVEDDQYMAQVIPHSEFVIVDNASHMVMMEQSDKVNILIEKFIATDPSTLGANETS